MSFDGAVTVCLELLAESWDVIGDPQVDAP
jgi:hypothetical protein